MQPPTMPGTNTPSLDLSRDAVEFPCRVAPTTCERTNTEHAWSNSDEPCTPRPRICRRPVSSLICMYSWMHGQGSACVTTARQPRPAVSRCKSDQRFISRHGRPRTKILAARARRQTQDRPWAGEAGPGQPSGPHIPFFLTIDRSPRGSIVRRRAGGPCGARPG
jgi:hypothetical protein